MVRTLLSCVACGASRTTDKFGIDAETVKFIRLPENPLCTTEHHFGIPGYRGVYWEHHPVNLEQALALRDNMKAALEKINAEIAQAQGND